MENGVDKHWAQKYLNDPLNGPVPSDETGPGTSFRRPETVAFPDIPGSTDSKPSTKTPAAAAARVEAQTTGGSNNPFRQTSSSSYKNGTTSRAQELSPSPSLAGARSTRTSGDLRRDASHRRILSTELNDAPSSRRSVDSPRDKARSSDTGGRPRRSSSLNQRYPGDKSHLPLEILEREAKLANRSPHLRKKHQPRADSIDQLDDSISRYHHEGPYDAALFARNTDYVYSPVAALRRSNNEAIRATPEDKIKDSLNDHYPLDGTAMVPPGMPDRFGRVYRYQEGTDMQREAGGDYKRWPGVDYLPEDIKGKGEPSFSIEEAEKRKTARRATAAVHHPNGEGGAGGEAGANSFELAERPRHTMRRLRTGSNPEGSSSGGQSYAEWEMQRRKSHGRNVSGDLRRRFGSGTRRQEA
ncbi:MAG: hypothetical protein M1828_005388 [Chrysothrix sp. TS-e1954]|nr:MAG: hypothetical protein M1828_005388 [Chrysothrix sp. TS-e1954]